MAVFERRSGFFPPEVLEDVRAVGRLFRRRTKADDGTAGFAWLWVLLLVYPFTDYLFTALVDEGVSTGIAAAAFVAFDAGIIIAVLLARGDRAGARFFGALVLVLDLTYAATNLLRDGALVEQLVYDVLYTILLAWVLAHIFRHEPIGRLLTARSWSGRSSAISRSRSPVSSATRRLRSS